MVKELYPALTCYVPKNFEVSSIKGYNHRWHEKYVWFIHTVLFDSLQSGNKFIGYVNLRSKLLKKFIGDVYYKQIIQQLVESGIIEANEKFSNGAFSKSYRLSPKYSKSGIRSIRLDKQTYCRKIEKYRQNYLADILKEQENIKHEFQALTYLRIDIEAATNYIHLNYDETSPQFKSRYIAIDQFHAMHKVSFADGHYTNIGFTFKVNKGRVYSPITMLPRDLEQFVYFQNYEGEDVLSADAPNSQLCFFHEFLKRKKQKIHSKKVNHIGEIRISRIDTSLMDGIHGRFGKTYNPQPTPPQPSLCGEVWEDIIFNGKGYETMMSLCKWKGKEHGHTSSERHEFKEEFFGNLFYNRYQPTLTAMEVVFRDNFPNEAKSLRSMKYMLGNDGLAVAVQSLEAYFFHSIIVNYMRTNHKTIPFGIKHDSIMLPASEGSYIIPELNELFKAFFNRNEIEFKVSVL